MKVTNKTSNDQMKEKAEYANAFIARRFLLNDDRNCSGDKLVESEKDTNYGFVLGYN